MLVAALRATIRSLATSRWPTRLHSDIDSLIHATRVVLDHTQSATRVPPGKRIAWRATWVSDEQALGDAGASIDRALNIPEPGRVG